MASAVYPTYKAACMSGGANVNLLTGNVKVYLIDTADYTYSGAHEFLTSVPSAARTAVSPNLGSKTVSATAVFDAADTTLSGATGDPSEALIIVIDTGTEATTRLVCYIDSATGLPLSPDGTDDNLTWNASGIFQL